MLQKRHLSARFLFFVWRKLNCPGLRGRKGDERHQERAATRYGFDEPEPVRQPARPPQAPGTPELPKLLRLLKPPLLPFEPPVCAAVRPGESLPRVCSLARLKPV